MYNQVKKVSNIIKPKKNNTDSEEIYFENYYSDRMPFDYMVIQVKRNPMRLKMYEVILVTRAISSIYLYIHNSENFGVTIPKS